ncbi:hypothetical protein CR513_49601, partial [Mucuna pruriens]
MYAKTCTRLDISFIVGMLAKFQSNPMINHSKAAKKIFRYLQDTKDYMFTYRRSNHLEVIGYSDSDYAECVDSRKSIFGYIFLLVGRMVSWKSTKQSVIATSTMKTKFVMCFEAIIQALWLQSFISRFGIVDGIPKLLRIYCDNFVKHRVSIKHISTNLMIANLLTKGLPPKTFIDHVRRMSIMDKSLLMM